MSKLLDYVDELKNLPRRFTNLAFFNDIRKAFGSVINALETVDTELTDLISRNIDNASSFETAVDIANFDIVTISNVPVVSINNYTQVLVEHSKGIIASSVHAAIVLSNNVTLEIPSSAYIENSSGEISIYINKANLPINASNLNILAIRFFVYLSYIEG